MAFLGARFNLGACLGQLLQPRLPPFQLLGNGHRVGHFGLVRHFDGSQQFRDFGLLVVPQSCRMLAGQRAVPASNDGVDLGSHPMPPCPSATRPSRGPVKTPRRIAPQSPWKSAGRMSQSCLVVRMVVRGNEAEGNRVARRTLQLAAGEHAGGAACRRLAGPAASPGDMTPNRNHGRSCSWISGRGHRSPRPQSEPSVVGAAIRLPPMESIKKA